MADRLTLTVSETAKVLGLSRTTLYKLMSEDKAFPAFHIGGRTLISAEALAEWVRMQAERSC